MSNPTYSAVPIIRIEAFDDSSIPYADQDPNVEAVEDDECKKTDIVINITDTSNDTSTETVVSAATTTTIHADDEDAAAVGQRRRNLRKNSISMPTGLDLDRLQQLHDNGIGSACQSAAEEISGSVTFSVPEKTSFIFDSTEDGRRKRPLPRDNFRSKRRGSIAPLPSLRLNNKDMLSGEFDTQSVMSNQASITSINSIASLLREKMQAVPQMIRKKKNETKDYNLKMFVVSLFFIIVFLIGYAYVMYHRKVLTRSYFAKAKFVETERVLRILNSDNEQMISAKLGVTLGSETIPFPCLEDKMLNDGSICLEWNNLARLYMKYEDKNQFRCYSVHWQALGSGVFPTDCYELAPENGLWFGGGPVKNVDWTLTRTNFPFSPFITGDMKVHQFGNTLKRYFINSLGISLQVNDSNPLYISANQSQNTFCLRAMNDDYAYVNRLTQYPELQYKVCVADDMRSLHMLRTQQSLWESLKEQDIKTLHSIIEEPIYKIPFDNESSSLNETSIYNYSEEVIAAGFMKLGHILVNEFWQENVGDFTVDKNRFPTLKDTIEVLHRRGFKIVLTVQPFISTDSPTFKEAVHKKLLIYERYSERSIPALTRYKSSSSAGVVDITNNASIPWLLEKLQAVVKEYQVDSFYLDLGTGYNLPHYYQCRQTLRNPDMYAKLFTSSFEGIGFMGVSTATAVPKPPAFLSAPPVNSSWSGLREILSTVLSYGVIGYPFILPGAIGGDYFLNRSLSKMTSFYSLRQADLPSQELFLRWLQLITFLPSMQFSHLPSEYKSDYVTDVAKELTNVRHKTVIPLLKKCLSDSLNEGLPLVRPLWLLDPSDPACLSVDDEFSIGEELIVAPVLEEGVYAREVYLPQGVWKDGIDGSLRKGSRWLHNYNVPKEKIAYFVKLPDNTRF